MGQRVKESGADTNLQRCLLSCHVQHSVSFCSVSCPSHLDRIQIFFLPGNHKSATLSNLFLFLQCLFAEVSTCSNRSKGLKVHLLQSSSFPPPHSPALWTLACLCLSQPSPHKLLCSHSALHTDRQERGREGARDPPSPSQVSDEAGEKENGKGQSCEGV